MTNRQIIQGAPSTSPHDGCDRLQQTLATLSAGEACIEDGGMEIIYI